MDAVNAVGMIKARFDQFLTAPRVTGGSPATTGTSVPLSSRSGQSPVPSPPPTTTPDTPTYHPTIPSTQHTEGGRAYGRARRYMVAQRGGYNRRRLPRMSGPTTHVGGWYNPHLNAPTHVPAHRYIPGWVPGMPRPPPPWSQGPAQTRGRSQQQSQPFVFQPNWDPQQGPFYFGRGGY